jgi:hypothetical protein
MARSTNKTAARPAKVVELHRSPDTRDRVLSVARAAPSPARHGGCSQPLQQPRRTFGLRFDSTPFHLSGFALSRGKMRERNEMKMRKQTHCEHREQWSRGLAKDLELHKRTHRNIETLRCAQGDRSDTPRGRLPERTQLHLHAVKITKNKPTSQIRRMDRVTP